MDNRTSYVGYSILAAIIFLFAFAIIVEKFVKNDPPTVSVSDRVWLQLQRLGCTGTSTGNSLPLIFIVMDATDGELLFRHCVYTSDADLADVVDSIKIPRKAPRRK